MPVFFIYGLAWKYIVKYCAKENQQDILYLYYHIFAGFCNQTLQKQ